MSSCALAEARGRLRMYSSSLFHLVALRQRLLLTMQLVDFPLCWRPSSSREPSVFPASPALGFPVCWAIPHFLPLNGCQAFKLRSSLPHSQCSFLLGPLPRLQCAPLCQVCQPQRHSSRPRSAVGPSWQKTQAPVRLSRVVLTGAPWAVCLLWPLSVSLTRFCIGPELLFQGH